MGPQEAKEFFTEHLEERRRTYDDRKLTPGGEGFMGLYYPNPFDPLERRKSNMEKDNIYTEMEWFAGGGGDPAKYEKSEIEIPVIEKKEERTMVIQTCENYMNKKQGHEPKRYWVVYMKDGQVLDLDRKAGYLDVCVDGKAFFLLKTEKKGRSLAVIPINNILWTKFIDEND